MLILSTSQGCEGWRVICMGPMHGWQKAHTDQEWV